MFKKTFKTSTGAQRGTAVVLHQNLDNICIAGEKYRKQVDPGEVDQMGRTSLHRAVLQTVDSDISLIEALKAGCDVNASDKYGRRAIHYAPKQGHVKCLWTLIRYKAATNVTSKAGLSPLMEAAKRNQLEALSVLVQAGTDVNLKNDVNEETAVHYAACSSEFECIKVLAQAKANLNAQDLHGKTALILAVIRSNEKIVKALVHEDVELDKVDGDGRTALHYAAFGNHLTCASMLTEAGASVDIVDKKGDTPFVLAIRKNSVDVLQVLMDANCDRMLIDGLMGTSVALAAVLGHAEAVNSLVQNGEDPDEAAYFGMTPLMLSSYESHVDVVNTLLFCGADSNGKGRIGCSPLKVVLLNVNSSNEVRRHELLSKLLRAGSEVNISYNGRGLFVGCAQGNNSPLSFAISIGYISAVRMLLIAGCEVPLDEVLEWIKTTNLWRFFDVGPIQKLLTDWVSEPRSLKHICRASIRSCLKKHSIENSIEKLPIAKILKRYTNYEELDSIEIERLPIMSGTSSAMLMNLNESPCGLRMSEGSILHLINSHSSTLNVN